MSGSASYAGNAIGLAQGPGSTSTSLSGTFNATANFGNATVVGGLTMKLSGPQWFAHALRQL